MGNECLFGFLSVSSLHSLHMRSRKVGIRSAALAMIAASLISGHPAIAQSSTDWNAVGQALGRSGAPQAGGVMRFAFPRLDLTVMMGDVQVAPALALSGWAAFLPTSTGTLVMGDLVLTLLEVAPVTHALEKGGITITAQHDHLVGETPRLTFVHIMARGDPVEIAKTIHDAIALSGTPLTLPPPLPPALSFPLDTARIARALGVTGKVNGGVYQTSIPVATPIVMDGITLPPAMGVAAAINIQPVDSTFAAAAGDFVVPQEKSQAVSQALAAHGLTVTAVHTHFMGSTPQLIFIHFWDKDSSARLAEGLAAALAAAR